MNINGFFGNSSLWGSSSSYGSFSSISTSSMLGDFAAIKNGSYKKLLKSYYAEKNDKTTGTDKKNGLTSTENKQVTVMASDMSGLKKAADALANTGKNSLFAEGENGVDKDKLYTAAKELVDAYNSAMDSTDDISVPVIDRKVGLTQNLLAKNAGMLSKIGISVKEGVLSIDEDKFKNADMSDIKTMLNGKGSIADKLSTRANDIYSVTQALLGNKTTTYNRSAVLTTGTSTGNIMDAIL